MLSSRKRQRATWGERAGGSPHIAGRTRHVQRFLELRPRLCKISARLRKPARDDEWLDEGAGSPVTACVLDSLSHPFRGGIQLGVPGAERSMAQADQGLEPARVVIVVRRRKAGLEEFLTSINVAHLPDDPRRA